MSQSSRMLVAGDIKQKLRRIFFETPCRYLGTKIGTHDKKSIEGEKQYSCALNAVTEE